MNSSQKQLDDDANRDPISRGVGAHPLGTGVGAALGGAAAWAATGIIAGPVGTIIGAAMGAVIGGLAGKDFAEVIDPEQEDTYWRGQFSDRSYAEHGASYEDFGPAYALGADSALRHPGRAFEDVEPEMSQTWGACGEHSNLHWNIARHAARDAWNRVNGVADDGVTELPA